MNNLNPNNVTRAIIESTVSRSIREIEEDPFRSIRKLADLGKRFSKGRFQNELFSIIQSLLQDGSSPYYQILQDVLQQVNHDTIKRLGINLGYNSWTYGAKNIRLLEETFKYNIPWNIIFQFNSSEEMLEHISSLEHVITQGEALGIYVYFIKINKSTNSLKEIFSVLEKYMDSSFYFFLSENYNPVQELHAISDCRNIMLHFNDKTKHDHIKFHLQKNKIPYGTYHIYHSGDEQCLEDLIHPSLMYESNFIYLVPSPDCSEVTQTAVAEFAKNSRFNPIYPAFIMELYSDILEINRIISTENCILELNAWELKSCDNLQDFLSKTMPKTSYI